MDLITGISGVTAAFLFSTALVALALTRAGAAADPPAPGRTRVVFVSLLIGLFVGLADVLVAAGLPTIAFLNVIAGAAAIAILHGPWGTGQRGPDEERWRR
ncbi:MAG: hypothetical protein IRY83_01120 [Chloroflexi bacterium]|nr:hypothetical protein [Chloroflexota bacterium]HZW31944.1 hypothetical protein [Isosphaeraceae bacterium]